MSNRTVFRAAWVVPVVQPPLRDGWVAVDGLRIAAVGSGAVGPAITAAPGIPSQESSALATFHEVDLGSVALMPGLVNAHTHLELAWLKGRVPPARSLPEWVRSLLAARAAGTDDVGEVRAAIAELVACGTAAVADIANTVISVEPLAACGLPAVVFHEVLGFDPRNAAALARAAGDRLRALVPGPDLQLRLAPHAPYSTSADLIRALADASRAAPWPPTAVHVGESAEEVQFIATGDGPWRTLLSDLHVWHDGWQPPGLSPVEYLDTLGTWQRGALAVHGVHLSDMELELLASRDVTLVTCPRSNRWVGVGAPPINRFLASGVRMAIGTDSLASAPDLNLFEELRAIRALAPDVPARTLLSWATVNGARALGMQHDWGTLEAGRRARFLAVQMGRAVNDVEEALVSGVKPADLTWIGDPFRFA